MTGKLKVLGVALAAMLAMTAVMASGAQAATSGLDVNGTTGGSSAILTAQQTEQLKYKYTASGTQFKCSQTNLEGTVPQGAIHEATLTPTFFEELAENCTLAGTNAKVTMNGCSYTLTDTLTSLTFEVDLVCESGHTGILIDQGACQITIPPQGPLSHVVLENVAGSSPKDVIANWTIQGFTYSGNAGCPANLQMTTTDGDITGKTTITAWNDIAGLEGSQIKLEAT
jgi:hypothetical protein